GHGSDLSCSERLLASVELSSDCDLRVCLFFFQAEDGIRDGHVTGVQTCALPISLLRRLPYSVPSPPPEAAATALPSPVARRHTRSEERRVGKECRTRWSP